MAVAAYDGHEHRLDAGGLVRHAVVDGGRVRLRVADDDGGDAEVELTGDEAVRFATSLLRDRNLIEHGSG